MTYLTYRGVPCSLAEIEHGVNKRIEQAPPGMATPCKYTRKELQAGLSELDSTRQVVATREEDQMLRYSLAKPVPPTVQKIEVYQVNDRIFKTLQEAEVYLTVTDEELAEFTRSMGVLPHHRGIASHHVRNYLYWARNRNPQ